jgi:L-asparaginase II
VKAIQALPLIESGAADRYGFGNTELALACASHNGEARHVATAAAMLAAAGRGEADLECGAHWPTNREAANDLVRSGREPSQLHNNCSGKHAGFICLACQMDQDPRGYVGPDHPAQREVTAALEAMTGAPLGPENRAIDGCAIPTFAIPLERLAHAFARFGTGEGLAPARAAAVRRLRDACFAEPFMIGGTRTFDTAALTAFSGRLFVKFGAEGVYCAALPELGLGVALKCDDGEPRGAETMMAAVADALLAPDDPGRESFGERFAPPVLTRKKVPVGAVRPVAGLVESLREGKRASA